MKPAAKLALQLLVLGALVFAATIIGSVMGWLQYFPDPLQLPDGGMVKIFRDDDGGVLPEADAGEVVDAGLPSDSGILFQESERFERP